MIRTALVTGTALAASLLFTPLVHARDSAPPPAAPTDDDPHRHTSAEIVVTGVLARPRQDVLSGVAVLEGAALDQAIRASIGETLDKTPGVSKPGIDFSYPYAVEHDGKLYVGYTHKSHIANELAVIPIAALRAD